MRKHSLITGFLVAATLLLGGAETLRAQEVVKARLTAPPEVPPRSSAPGRPGCWSS